MTNLIDIGVFMFGVSAVTLGVGMYDWRAALVVLGALFIGIVVTARITGGKRE